MARASDVCTHDVCGYAGTIQEEKKYCPTPHMIIDRMYAEHCECFTQGSAHKRAIALCQTYRLLTDYDN